MATWELQLLSRIVRTGDLSVVNRWGITPFDFRTQEGRALFSSIESYKQQQETGGAVMGPQALQQKFPNFTLCDDAPHMTVEALCLEVRKQRITQDFAAQVQRSLELVSHDPIQAIGELQGALTGLQNLGVAPTHDMHFADGFSKQLMRYELIKQGVDLSCGSWPWMPLQLATLGLQPEDYVVVYGRPKSMKSWIIAFLLSFFFDQRKRMLVFTKEMTPENIFWRAGACLAEVRYAALRTAQLTIEEEREIYLVEKMLRMSMASQTVVCLSGSDAPDGGDTVPWLKAKVEHYKPHVVFIDGIYLMSDHKGATKDHARVRNISRAIRQMILDTGVPVIGTLQANRAAAANQEAKLDEIAFSDSIGMDATVIMRTINEKDKPTLALVIGGSREFELEGFRIYGVPATNFSYEGEITTGDILDAKETDDKVEGEKPRRRRKAKAKPKENPKEDAEVAKVTRHMGSNGYVR